MDSKSSAFHAHPWDTFLIGPENSLAHAAVIALARGEEPGLSPLVLYGPSGTGKSRLLSGLVSERMSRQPDCVIAHLEAEVFASLCLDASKRAEGWSDLRGRFRGLDLFVLEDLHALEHAPAALHELSHTLDALAESGAVVAVSARSALIRWPNWPQRLLSRLLGGLSIRLEPPGLQTRRQYLLQRARAQGITLPAGLIEQLAKDTDGYRSIDGLLLKLALDARVTKRQIDEQTVTATLTSQDSLRPHVTIDGIARAVATCFRVRVKDLRSASRRASVAQPRQLAILLARRWTGLSFVRIGEYFGKRDPATIRHACHIATERLAADPKLMAAIATLESGWQSHQEAS